LSVIEFSLFSPTFAFDGHQMDTKRNSPYLPNAQKLEIVSAFSTLKEFSVREDVIMKNWEELELGDTG
jgi:hypothetical protein